MLLHETFFQEINGYGNKILQSVFTFPMMEYFVYLSS